MTNRATTLFVVAGVFMAALLSAVTASADPTAPDVSGTSEYGSVDIEAHVPGKPGSTKPKPQAGKPTKEVSVQPICGSFEVDPDNRSEIYCAADQCTGDDQQYLRTVEDLETGYREFEHFCGLPDRDPGTLAVAEFYSKTVTVSYPTIAPHTNTYANFPNIFWSDVVVYEEDTDISVADVKLKFIPVSYRWDFGDGETMTLKEPGKPYDPELVKVTQDADKYYENIHRYRKLGTFDVTLTVVFNGQYSVNGGDWQDIAGSVQAASPPHPLTVRQARGELIKPPGN